MCILIFQGSKYFRSMCTALMSKWCGVAHWSSEKGGLSNMACSSHLNYKAPGKGGFSEMFASMCHTCKFEPWIRQRPQFCLTRCHHCTIQTFQVMELNGPISQGPLHPCYKDSPMKDVLYYSPILSKACYLEILSIINDFLSDKPCMFPGYDQRWNNLV